MSMQPNDYERGRMDAWIGMRASIEEADKASRSAIAARLRAFARDCVTHGDMTPSGARMLDRIADEVERTRTVHE